MLTPITEPIEQVDLVEAEEGFRQWQMVEALNAYCYAERSRARMLANLRDTLTPHGVLVLDCSGYKWGQR